MGPAKTIKCWLAAEGNRGYATSGTGGTGRYWGGRGGGGGGGASMMLRGEGGHDATCI